MKKGIVMEISDEYITMLTPDGDFIKALNHHNNYQLGEEVSFFPVSEQQSSRVLKRQRFYKMNSKLAWISSFVAIILFLSLIPTIIQNKVYAYMSIDINPSFEVGLDHELNVISIDALNEEGTIILDSIDSWKKQNVEVVTELILEESRENGYLETGEEVLITTVINDDDDNELELLLRKDLEEISTSYQQEEILITSIESNEETRSKAIKQGISTGKLLQLEKKAIVEKKEQTNDNEINNQPQKTNINNEEVDVEVVNGKEANIKVEQQVEESNKEDKHTEKAIEKENKKEKVIQKKDEKKEEKAKKEAKKEVKKDKKNEKNKKHKEKVEEKRHQSNMPDHVRKMLEDKFQDRHQIDEYFWE